MITLFFLIVMSLSLFATDATKDFFEVVNQEVAKIESAIQNYYPPLQGSTDLHAVLLSATGVLKKACIDRRIQGITLNDIMAMYGAIDYLSDEGASKSNDQFIINMQSFQRVQPFFAQALKAKPGYAKKSAALYNLIARLGKSNFRLEKQNLLQSLGASYENFATKQKGLEDRQRILEDTITKNSPLLTKCLGITSGIFAATAITFTYKMGGALLKNGSLSSLLLMAGFTGCLWYKERQLTSERNTIIDSLQKCSRFKALSEYANSLQWQSIKPELYEHLNNVGMLYKCSELNLASTMDENFKLFDQAHDEICDSLD